MLGCCVHCRILCDLSASEVPAGPSWLNLTEPVPPTTQPPTIQPSPTSQPVSTASPLPSIQAGVAVKPYEMCGGKGKGCKGSNCVDAPWQGCYCMNRLECTRMTPYWWRCDTPKHCAEIASASACKVTVAIGGTCGGAGSDCTGCQCRDGPWGNYCCAKGSKCVRKSVWFWGCQ